MANESFTNDVCVNNKPFHKNNIQLAHVWRIPLREWILLQDDLLRLFYDAL